MLPRIVEIPLALMHITEHEWGAFKKETLHFLMAFTIFPIYMECMP